MPLSEASTSIIPLKNNCRGDKEKGLIHSLSCFLHKICYLGPLPKCSWKKCRSQSVEDFSRGLLVSTLAACILSKEERHSEMIFFWHQPVFDIHAFNCTWQIFQKPPPPPPHPQKKCSGVKEYLSVFQNNGIFFSPTKSVFNWFTFSERLCLKLGQWWIGQQSPTEGHARSSLVLIVSPVQ